MRRQQFLRLTASARYVVLFAVGVPVLWSQDGTGGRALMAIAALWAAVQYATAHAHRVRVLVPILDAVAVGMICGLVVDRSPAVLATLALAPFVGGLLRGGYGVALAISAQTVALVIVAVLTDGALSTAASQAAFTWSIGAAGLGLVGNFVRAAAMRPPEGAAAYRAARDLLRELTELSAGLGGSLDVPTIADELLRSVAERIPAEGLVLYLPRDASLVPILRRDGADVGRVDAVAARAVLLGVPVQDGTVFAFPLGPTAVVAGECHGAVTDGLPVLVRETATALEDTTVRLDAALLFADFRDTATADERRRLAREMHDGVAQDLAGLGYLVDALAAKADSPEQLDRCAALRGRLTDVVAEVRRSVLALRSNAAQSDSLEAAIESLAGRLSESSGIPIQVTCGEPGPRLRPEVEAELYRVAQEAMTNAVKHARAARIEVDCVVQAPGALITVSDDGRGLGPGRTDSYGLTIMRERARLIGAEVTHREPPGGGTRVEVRLPSGRIPSTRPVADTAGAIR